MQLKFFRFDPVVNAAPCLSTTVELPEWYTNKVEVDKLLSDLGTKQNMTCYSEDRGCYETDLVRLTPELREKLCDGFCTKLAVIWGVSDLPMEVKGKSEDPGMRTAILINTLRSTRQQFMEIVKG